ncbi:hypothetical protein [Streptomyces bullii]|uniref:ATP synthase subunit b n=1 Tax=Streptomyces bullii TaxID=349910 RepID=A0ABW0UUG8_9ACTN
MELIALNLGPMNPRPADLAVAVALFAVSHLVMTRLLRRINRVLQARERATAGVGRQADDLRAQAEAAREEAHALLAEARHEAAGIRQRAQEQGAGLIAAARADGVRERDGLLAEADARIKAERAAAETELRLHVAELAAELASRVVGEPIGPPSRTPAGDTR